ncbi:SURF1 family cytochrome oxidase biogenesis protein [Salinarimonas rosea]|uniref:SURF1 family cytochrome oxidase biogenesis protein n=1 Tax=Salinarimonas rosea TaxID=552063 RepID=UPI0004287DED
MAARTLSENESAPPPRWRSLIMAGVATLVSLAILIGLGTWQLQRLAWKEGVIARIEARAHGAPGEILPEAQWDTFSRDEQEYRRVAVTGSYRFEDEVAVHGLLPGETRGQPLQGYYLLTPLELDTGAVVVVNRGFVPTPLVDEAARPAGALTVEGLVRASEERTPFVPENDPEAGQWFTRDLAAIADARGLDRVAPFYVDAVRDESADTAWPRGGATVLEPPNNHLQYAFTWFGLAAVLVAVFGVFSWKWLQGRAT